MKDTLCRRTEYFVPAFAADGANGSRWMAADRDNESWIVADLGTTRKVRRSEVYFVRPTAGHAYLLEGSSDGKVWEACGGHEEAGGRAGSVGQVPAGDGCPEAHRSGQRMAGRQ